MAVGVLQLDAVMAGTRSDQNVNGRRCLSGFAAPTCQGTGHGPHLVRDGQIGKRVLKVAQGASIVVVPDPVPEF